MEDNRLAAGGRPVATTQMDVTLTHNYRHRWLFSRTRSEKLMTVLHCVGAVSPDAKVLVIGPRNEAEILLLACYGFHPRNITGVDLFTYSPRIRAMDMHKMAFADDAFDVVFVSWVLKYAYDLPRACREIVRVVRPGGVVAVGYTQTVSTSAIVGQDAELAGGLSEMHEKFAPYVDHVYWQEADPAGEGNHRVTSIFRVKK